MKSSSLILPALILIAATSWIAYQRRSLFTVRSVNAKMEQTLVSLAKRSRTASVATELVREKPSKPAENAGSIGGKKLIIQMAETLNNQYSPEDPAWEFLKQQIKSLSKEDLVAALDETTTQKLHMISRDLIDQAIIEALGIIDPELTLNRCADLMINGQPNLAEWLTSTFGGWSENDPQKAGEWLDQQIASGKFGSKRLDDKNAILDRLDAGLIDGLLIKDPAAAKLRLKSFSDAKRGDVTSKLAGLYRKDLGSISLEDFTRAYVLPSDSPSASLLDCYHIIKGVDPK
jgi:hypothetical protein